MTKLLLTVLFLAMGMTLFANITPKKINGRVVDAMSGETLPGTTISIKGTMTGVVSDDEGKFSISVEKNRTTLVVSYIGYRTVEVAAEVGKACNISLSPIAETLNEVVATGESRNLSNTTMGMEILTAKEIKRIPALLGEVDIIKAIQMLPGVLPTSEGGSGYSVRGGSADQNLILLDNAVVYNPSHLLGFFSTFNNDIVGSVSLYKGDLPLKYGGRLSSLLDVQTTNHTPERLTINGGIGLLSSRATVETPVGSKLSLIASGRRSYLDIFTKLAANETIKESSLYFYDLNGKIAYQPTAKHRIALNGYYGKDYFSVEYGTFAYGNSAASLIWGYTITPKSLLRTTVAITNYDYSIEANISDKNMGIAAQITDYAARVDMLHMFNNDWRVEYGMAATLHNIDPGTVWMSNMTDYSVDKNKAVESGLFVSSEHKVGERFNVRYGVRFSMFQNIGKALVYKYNSDYEICDSTQHNSGIYNTYTNFEPRIGIAYNIDANSSVKANFARNAQYMQLANNSASGSPLDIWFPASPNIRPQVSDMYSVGYFRNIRSWETSVEVYYKNQKNVVDFADHANLLLNTKLEGEVRSGKGKAYGAEFSVQKTKGTLTGFANYTLSRSERTVEAINDGKTYLAPYDKLHSINISTTYELSKKHAFSLSWVYATGNPTTYPTGRFQINQYYYPIFSGRNEYRKPNYHRLDISWTLTPKHDTTKRWRGEWNFSIFNLYGNKNPWIIQYNQDDNSTPKAEMTYLFGMVPSVTYNFYF